MSLGLAGVSAPWVAQLAGVLAALCAMAACLLWFKSGQPLAGPTRPSAPTAGWLHRGRFVWVSLAVGGWVELTDGAWRWLGGLAIGLGMLALIARAERARQTGPAVSPAAVRAQLPELALLIATALRAGAAPSHALPAACAALPGAAALALEPTVRQLRLGADPGEQWALLAEQETLAPLGRALLRAHRHGASVSEAIARLAEELAEAELSLAEERARAVGVRAALPLGLCLLPAFVLLAVVPVAAGLLAPILGG